MGAVLAEGAVMPDAELYMAREGYIDYPAANTPTPVRARATARAGHPIIKRTPHLWVPLEVDYEVEQPKAETKQTAKKSSGG
jgi:hypothetical protein